jgi:hypothetical protein
MPHQAKYFLLIASAFVLLGAVLMQNACNKDEEKYAPSREEFINRLKGDWYVWSYDKGYNYLTYVNILMKNDSVIYQTFDSLYYQTFDSIYYHKRTYAVNDPTLCTLAEIENMQNWTIAENTDSLMLETIDLCGVTKSFHIEYSNYLYYFTAATGVRKDIIYANIKLVSPDTTAWLNNFCIDSSTDTVSMVFSLQSGSIGEGFTLRHP